MKTFRRTIFMFLATLAISLPTTVTALTNQLEIDFPEIGGVKPGYSFGLANWVQYIYLFSLAIVGLAVIASFVYAGIEWLTAGDNESKVKSARGRIKSAIIGLLLLLGSYIILNTINPDLVSLKSDVIDMNIGKSSGVLEFLKDKGEYCTADGECKSGKCDMEWSIIRSQNGRCVGQEEMKILEVGQRCDNGYECKTGFCDYKPGVLYKTCIDKSSETQD